MTCRSIEGAACRSDWSGSQDAEPFATGRVDHAGTLGNGLRALTLSTRRHAESGREATQGRFRPRFRAPPMRIDDKRHRGAGQTGACEVGQRTEDASP